MNFQRIKEPDCRYQLILNWSVEYNIDFLESLHSFRTIVSTKSKFLTELIPESSVDAHNTVGYITSTCILNNISHLEQPN